MQGCSQFVLGHPLSFSQGEDGEFLVCWSRMDGVNCIPDGGLINSLSLSWL